MDAFFKIPRGGLEIGGVAQRRQRATLAAADAAIVEAEQAVADPGSPLDQLVLGSFGPQLGGDLLARHASRAEDADVNEEQRLVLQVEPALQLGIAQPRPPGSRRPTETPAARVELSTPVHRSREALQGERRGRQRELHQRR